tara:strand:- start:25725 stop:26108 length:384 start_codon:yes stop_codon:yes gene_type:complete
VTQEHDAETVKRVAMAIAQNGFGRPWDDFLPVNAQDTDHSDLMEYARAAISAMPARKVSADTVRLDAIAANYWDLRCIPVPTGQGDADVDWEIVEHHEGKKGDVVIAQAYGDDPRVAIDRAIAGDKP